VLINGWFGNPETWAIILLASLIVLILHGIVLFCAFLSTKSLMRKLKPF